MAFKSIEGSGSAASQCRGMFGRNATTPECVPLSLPSLSKAIFGYYNTWKELSEPISFLSKAFKKCSNNSIHAINAILSSI